MEYEYEQVSVLHCSPGLQTLKDMFINTVSEMNISDVIILLVQRQYIAPVSPPPERKVLMKLWIHQLDLAKPLHHSQLYRDQQASSALLKKKTHGRRQLTGYKRHI